MDAKVRNDLDPISLEVIRNKLTGIADEMQYSLLRSAFSPIVKEGLDASASLFTFSWDCRTGYVYQVRYSSSLHGTWHDIGPALIPEPGEETLTFTDPSPQAATRCYRVERTPIE